MKTAKQWIDESNRSDELKELFWEREMQLLIPSKRMRFYNAITGETGKTPTFKAAYFAVNLFRESLILQEMNIT